MNRPPVPTVGAGRFAPTPTGDLHLGNARTALLAWLTARRLGLRNILRVEDLDPGAIPAGCLDGQLEDLAWLGLTYDEGPREGGPVGPYRQSERFDQYARVLEALNARGLIYPCWCSRREVRDAARAPHASDEGPVYAGTCKPAVLAPLVDLSALPARRGRAPALRLDVAGALRQLGSAGQPQNGDLEYLDAVAGPQRFHLAAAMGDFVVRRVDGVAAYQVACAWDDVAMGCTLVVRGADLIPSTARQLLILRALDLPTPTYGHVGLVLSDTGERLAKRDHATSLRGLRAAGRSPDAIRAQLARSAGLPNTGELEILIQAVELGALPSGPARLPR